LKTDLLRLLSGALVAAALATSGHGYTYILNSNTNLPVKWPDGTVNLRVMLGTAPTLIDGTNYSTSADGAAKTWNALLGSIIFQSTITTGTPTDGRPAGGSRANELAFASTIYGKDFGEKTLAVTTTWREGNTRIEGDILYNSARTWDSYSGNLRGSGTTGIYDIHRVTLHELGHLLGLDHPDDPSDDNTMPQTVSAIMNSTIGNLDTLTMDDITGAQNLYGPPGPPENNNFAAATAINNLTSSGSVKYTGFNTLATKETGEPSHAGNAGGHSVWWKWTAPANGSVTLDTRGSYFDTTLGVYTGTSVNALTTLGSNDDLQNDATAHVQASKVSFGATTGTTYYFGIDGFDADTGGITLNLAFTASGGTLATITTQPASVTVTAGGSATFTVAATAGSSTISYQWRRNGTAISGATNATLTLSNVTSANDAGDYTVVVMTEAGMVTSNVATLTVNAAPVVTPPSTPSGGGGGGGGAPSGWFFAALSLLAAARLLGMAPASRFDGLTALSESKGNR